VAALERELARREADAEEGDEGVPFPDPGASVAVDKPRSEPAEEEDEEHEEQEIDEDDYGDDDDGVENEEESGGDVLTGMRGSTILDGSCPEGELSPQALPRRKLENNVSFRKDPPYCFESRNLLKRRFGRLRDLKSPLGLDLDEQSSRHNDSNSSLPPDRREGSSGFIPKKMADISQDSFRSFTASFGMKGAVNRPAARDRLPSNDSESRRRALVDKRDDSDSIEDGCSDMSHDGVDAGASAVNRRSSVLGRLLKSKSLRKRKPSGSVASALSLSSAREEGEEEEEEAQDLKGNFSIRVYLKSASVMALWLTDLILFIILEIIWIDSVCTSDDYSDPMGAAPAGADDVLGELGLAGKSRKRSHLCMHYFSICVPLYPSPLCSSCASLLASPSFSFSTFVDKTPLHHTYEMLPDVHYRLRWEIILLKSAISLCYLFKIYTVFGKTYRIQNVKSVFGRPLLSLWAFLLVLAACVAILVAEVAMCASSDATFFPDNVESMQRVKVSLHLLRIIFAWSLLIYRLKKTFRRKMQTAVSSVCVFLRCLRVSPVRRTWEFILRAFVDKRTAFLFKRLNPHGR
jgi:hypothetical protein